MYILKIKGTAKIPDYIQLRGDDFTLKAYFRLDRPDKSLDRIGMGDKLEKIMEFAATLPFGKIEKIEL